MLYEDWIKTMESRSQEPTAVYRAQQQIAAKVETFDALANKILILLNKVGGIRNFLNFYSGSLYKIKRVLKNVLTHFEINEDYEKCAVIRDELKII